MGLIRGIRVDYAGYSYSAETQAEFFKAEAEMLRFADELTHSPSAKYMRSTLLAIDAVFAIRIAEDVTLPVVPLITSFDLTDWKHHGDTKKSVRAQYSEFQFPKEHLALATEALHYMQCLEWIADMAKPDTTITVNTILHLHEILLNGKTADNRYHGFRTTSLPNGKGTDPALIPSEISDLCRFINANAFSPIGQASVIHHAFESIAPLDSMVDRTGLVVAFISLFKRGLYTDGYMAPICWGASLEKDFRKVLRDSSRDKSSPETHLHYREAWAAYNARNTYMSVVIARSFLSAATQLRTKWRSQGLRIPTNSALDRLLDLLLAIPGVSTIRAADIIGKSYGATNEAMAQLAKAGIVREVALDGRERVFICDQSAAMITEFVENLVKISMQAETGNPK